MQHSERNFMRLGCGIRFFVDAVVCERAIARIGKRFGPKREAKSKEGLMPGKLVSI